MNDRPDLRLYGGEDPRDRPRYTYRESSRATGIPATTIAAWVRGQTYKRKVDVGCFESVIARPKADDTRLSFNNLIELHVLRALREVHDVKMGYIREAIDLAEREFGVTRLLVSPQLRTSAGALFLDRYFSLVELSQSAQFAMRSILVQFLERVQFDETQLPTEFYPIEKSLRRAGQRLISLSPFVAFGQPIIERVGVSTHAIAQRFNVGEARKSVMRDYGLRDAEFEEAILYEAA